MKSSKYLEYYSRSVRVYVSKVIYIELNWYMSEHCAHVYTTMHVTF